MIKVILAILLVSGRWVWTGGHGAEITLLSNLNITGLQWLAAKFPAYFIAWNGGSFQHVATVLEMFFVAWLVVSFIWFAMASMLRAKPVKPAELDARSKSTLMPQRRAAPDGHGGYTPSLRSGSGSQH